MKPRPHLYDFLEYVSAKYELIVFCNGDMITGGAVLDYVERNKKYFEHRFYSDHSLFDNASFSIKYYDFLLNGARTLENTVIVDSSVPSYCLHIFNGVPLRAYRAAEKKEDCELIYLAKFLGDLERTESVQLTLGTSVRSTMLKWRMSHGSSSLVSGNSSSCSGSIEK